MDFMTNGFSSRMVFIFYRLQIISSKQYLDMYCAEGKLGALKWVSNQS